MPIAFYVSVPLVGRISPCHTEGTTIRLDLPLSGIRSGKCPDDAISKSRNSRGRRGTAPLPANLIPFASIEQATRDFPARPAEACAVDIDQPCRARIRFGLE
jgi:hypothetical protein